MTATRKLAKWLEWLPRMRHEEHDEPEPEPGPAGSPLTGRVERINGLARIEVAGELDLSNIDRLRAPLAELESERPDVLELDIRALTFMDSTGLAELFAANRRAREQERRLVLLKGPGPIERVLELAKVEDAIDVVTEPGR